MFEKIGFLEIFENMDFSNFWNIVIRTSVGGCGTHFWKEFVSRSAAAGHIFGEQNRTSVGGCGTHFWSDFLSEKQGKVLKRDFGGFQSL